MYKLIRFYNQNRKKIIKIILIIVLILVIIQLLNNISKNKSNNTNFETNISSNNEYSQQLISDKSAISGGKISSDELQNDVAVIDKFIKYCNKQDINSAYELLTDECKEEMFPTVEDFDNIYYSKVFGGEKKTYTVENWTGDIYQVRITGDILSTGKLDNTETKQDYITIVDKDSEYKLNINNYIGRTNVDKTTLYEDVEINVISKDTYMDYEIYNFSISNNSENTVMLDTGDNAKSVYLLDSKDVKYYFYGNEISNNRLIIQSKYKNNIEIKFMNSYSSSRKIKYLIFSRLVLNYDEYKNLENKSDYSDLYEFKVEV